MNWIEVIQIRAFNRATKEKALKLAKEFSKNCSLESLKAVALWVRSDMQTDISIMLRWIGKGDQRAYSPLGLQIAEDFTEFGWVTHSVWQDADGV